jgi:phage-related protein
MVRNRYQIVLFIGQDDSNPIFDYIYDDKNDKDLIVIINVIQSLSKVGQDLLDTDMAKPLGGPIFELRKDRHRITYAQDKDRFVLLSAFLKKSEKTPPKEKALALERYEEYCRFGKCQVMKFAVDF